jgi:hypothetical protein
MTLTRWVDEHRLVTVTVLPVPLETTQLGAGAAIAWPQPNTAIAVVSVLIAKARPARRIGVRGFMVALQELEVVNMTRAFNKSKLRQRVAWHWMPPHVRPSCPGWVAWYGHTTGSPVV